jgi:hypothetical protein
MQLAVAQLRTIETRRPLLRPTMTGVTAAVDAHGRVMAEVPIGRAALLEVDVPTGSVETPYVRFGDWVGRLAILAAFACLLLGLRGRRSRLRVGLTPGIRADDRGMGVPLRSRLRGGPIRMVRSQRPDGMTGRRRGTEDREAIG